MLQLPPQLLQVLGVCLVVHIGQYHVRPAPAPHLVALQREMCVPDAAAQQSRVLHHRLRKAVVAAPQDLAVRRLLHAPAGKLLGVNHGAVVKALQQEDGLADEGPLQDLINVVFTVHLAEGDAAVNKVLHVRRLRRQVPAPPQQEGYDALNNAVVAIAVDDVQPPLPAAHIEVPVDDVVIAAHAQQRVQRPLVFAEAVCQCVHPLSSDSLFAP